MVRILGIIQMVVILIICIYELRKKSCAVFLWGILLIMFGIPHMLASITGGYKFSTVTMNKASIFVILFSLIYLLFRYLIAGKTNNNILSKMKLSDDEIENTKKFMYLLFIIMIGSIIIRTVLLIRQAGNVFNTSWNTMRETASGYFSFSQIFTPVFFASSSCILFALLLKNKKVIIISIIMILLEVVVSRNRIEILPIFIAVMYGLILKKDKLSLKNIIIIAIIGIFALYLVYALRVFRLAGSISNFFEKYDLKSFNHTVAEYIKEDDGELGLREYMYYFIENGNNFKNFEKGHTYIRMIFALVPTKWSFGLKPDDFNISMGQAVLPKAVGFSVHPTLFGDVYANFGFWGFLWGTFWAAFVTVIDKIIYKKDFKLTLVLSCLFGMTYVIQARGSVYNAFTWSIYGYIIAAIVYTVFKKRRKHEKAF